jgi:hypothetical protein
MAKKTLDPNAVAALLAKGKQEATHVARVEEVPAKTSPRLKRYPLPRRNLHRRSSRSAM